MSSCLLCASVGKSDLGADMLRRFVQYWVGKIVARPLHRKFAAFEAACQDPQRTQDELLRSIVQFQRDTDFGKDHGFATIRTVEDYRRQVPVGPYERLE